MINKPAAEKDIEFMLKKWMQNCSDKVLAERRKSLGVVRVANGGIAQANGAAAQNDDQARRGSGRRRRTARHRRTARRRC